MFKKILKVILVKYYAYKKHRVVEYANRISFNSIKEPGEVSRPLKNVDIFPSARLSSEVNKIKIGGFCSIASGVVGSAFTTFLGFFLHSAIMKTLNLKYINKKYTILVSISYIRIFFLYPNSIYNN